MEQEFKTSPKLSNKVSQDPCCLILFAFNSIKILRSGDIKSIASFCRIVIMYQSEGTKTVIFRKRFK